MAIRLRRVNDVRDDKAVDMGEKDQEDKENQGGHHASASCVGITAAAAPWSLGRGAFTTVGSRSAEDGVTAVGEA